MIQIKELQIIFYSTYMYWNTLTMQWSVFKNDLCISTISSTFKFLLIFFLFIFGFWHSQKELLSETRNRGRK